MLGTAGLIPFAAGAGATLYFSMLEPPNMWMAGEMLFLQMTYGATVLSFLGAAHWGFAGANYSRSLQSSDPSAGTVSVNSSDTAWGRYIWGVVPQLLAWSSLTQHPTTGMVMLLSGFAGSFIADVIADRKGLVPAWYLKMRFPLTIGAMAFLGVTFVQML